MQTSHMLCTECICVREEVYHLLQECVQSACFHDCGKGLRNRKVVIVRFTGHDLDISLWPTV